MRTANIASALFVVGLLVSGNLTGGGVQPSNIVLASIIASPTSSFLAEIYLPATEAGLLLETSDSQAIIKTLRIAIDARDGLQSCYAVANKNAGSTNDATTVQLRDTQDGTGSLVGLYRSFDVAGRPALSGEAYPGGQQVAHSLFRYDSVKAPDIPRNI